MTTLELVQRGIMNSLGNWKVALLWFLSNILSGILYIIIVLSVSAGIILYAVNNSCQFDYDFANNTGLEDAVVLIAEIVIEHWIIFLVAIFTLLVIFTIYASLICFLRGGMISTLIESEGKFGNTVIPFRISGLSGEFSSFNFKEFLKKGKEYFSRSFFLYFLFAPLYHLMIILCMTSWGICIYYGITKSDGVSIAIAFSVAFLSLLITIIVCILVHMADIMGYVILIDQNKSAWESFLAGFRAVKNNLWNIVKMISCYFLISLIILGIFMIIQFSISLIGIIPLASIITFPLSIILSAVKSLILLLVMVATFGSYVSLYKNTLETEYDCQK